MSAPTPAPGDDRPREGYYPDPSIPGYVRYWNGASWVPGTSRPAPADGEPLSPPPGVQPAAPAAAPPAAVPPAQAAAPVEETGPHFFDEDPEPGPAPSAGEQYGSRPEPATAWAADRARQSGFGGDQDRRVAWGTAPGDAHQPDPSPAAAAPAADPRVAHSAEAAAPAAPAVPPAEDEGDARTPAPAPAPAPAPDQGSGNTFVFRRPRTGPPAAPGPVDDGTMTFRPVPRRTGEESGQPAHPATAQAQAPAVPQQTQQPQQPQQPQQAHQAHQAPQPQHRQPSAPQPAPQSVPPQSVPPQSMPPQSGSPLTSGPGGGQSSWAQQVHQLAGSGGSGGPGGTGGTGGAAGSGEEPVTPWRPPVEDPFQALARRQASARPAPLGKRLAARLVDTVAVLAVTAVAAVPLGTKAMDHINGKIDEAKLSGRTVTVWLLDGTTGVYLAVILAVLLLFGVLYEALPTAKWGRTLGKRLFGLEVRDIEGHDAPAFGAALRRWLVYSVPGLLCFGLIGVLWCLFDKPWRQCWHDKAARTFVAAS
ncbi:RDD family protein [Streptomyces sp. NPDC091377]|uniref:RDD family protein n=1 Tax=Streptomyces sp. NPDC091377 TaxID=3365995 RepID=UPI00381592D1